MQPVLTDMRFPGGGDVELVDSIHAQNVPPHCAEMRDDSAKSKGKPPNCTTFVVQFVQGLLTTLLSSANTPCINYGALAKIQNPWGGGGDFCRFILEALGELGNHRGYNPEKKRSDVSDRIRLDCTGLEGNPIRNVAKKSNQKRLHDCQRSTTKISTGNSPGHEDG